MDRRSQSIMLVLALVVSMAAGCAHTTARGSGGTLRIYLARHGQTDWNAERRLQGWSDTHLNATGRQQAEKLGETLRGTHLDRVYSSTLSRSRETAEIVRGSTSLESLDGLREQRLGKFEGQKVGAADSVLNAEWERRSHDLDDSLDGGESANQHFERVRVTVDGIVARHPSGNILIVGHGGTNKMILRALLHLSAEQADAIRQANDELYLIEIEPGLPPHLWKAIRDSNLSDL